MDADIDSMVWQILLHDVLNLTLEHLIIVVISSSFAIAIGVTVGILGTRNPRLRQISLVIANVFQTIPSLALFGFLLPIPIIGGVGMHTAILSLVLYGLLPILRNTVIGILNVDRPVRDAAIAMGMTQVELLRYVELPLAAPTIIAGIRTSVVTTIGTATIAAAIGAGGLGVLIFRGVASVDTLQIMAGAVPAACLAILVDWLLGYLERKTVVRR